MNLFDITKGADNIASEKARDANCYEIRAYLEWLAERDGVAIPAGAKFEARGITVGATYSRNGDMLAGKVVLPMPGYGVPQVVTCEILDDDGNVIRTMPLPADKRGKLPMTAKQAQEWSGLTPVRASRRKAAKPAPIAVAEHEPAPVPEIRPTAAQETREAVAVASEALEPIDAPHRAEIASLESSEDIGQLPPPTVKERLMVEPDPIAELIARVEALETRIEALPVERGAAPTVEARARRTAAHERAIRRAWAERKAQRANRFQLNLRRDQLDNANRRAEYFRNLAEGETVRANRAAQKRRRAAQRARRMIAVARAETKAQRQAAAGARFELAKLRRDMADPTQPERASDIARLKRERDEARNAVAALQGRAERAEHAVNDLAERFEGMVSRVSRAEAALRSARAA